MDNQYPDSGNIRSPKNPQSQSGKKRFFLVTVIIICLSSLSKQKGIILFLSNDLPGCRN
jgi:hypothetical protein